MGQRGEWGGEWVEKGKEKGKDKAGRGVGVIVRTLGQGRGGGMTLDNLPMLAGLIEYSL